MRNELKILKTNDKVKVIDELEEAECYVVEYEAEEDGETVTKVGYMQLDKVMKYRYSAPKSSGGGSSGGGAAWGAVRFGILSQQGGRKTHVSPDVSGHSHGDVRGV